MDTAWHDEFRQRMADFDAQMDSESAGMSLSIKVRVSSGCCHREHSPNAYEAIDAHLATHPIDLKTALYTERESGPELLLCLALTTAGLALAKSIVDLITTLIKARSDGIKKGDRPDEPLELIVRRIQKEGEYEEEVVLRIAANTVVSKDMIRKAIDGVLQRHSFHALGNATELGSRALKRAHGLRPQCLSQVHWRQNHARSNRRAKRCSRRIM